MLLFNNQERSSPESIIQQPFLFICISNFKAWPRSIFNDYGNGRKGNTFTRHVKVKANLCTLKFTLHICECSPTNECLCEYVCLCKFWQPTVFFFWLASAFYCIHFS